MSAVPFSRRLFLGGVASLAVASPVKTATSVPTIYGDMVHDDAPGLNALFRGDPVRILNSRAIVGERPALVGGRLLVGSQILVKAGGFLLANASLTAAPGFEGKYLMKIDGVGGQLENITLNFPECPGGAAFLTCAAIRTSGA